MLNVPVSSLLSTAILLNAILRDVILLNVVAPQTFTTPALLEDPKLAKVLESFWRWLFFCFQPNLSKNTIFAKHWWFTLVNAILHYVILLNVVAPQTFTMPAFLEDPKLAKVLESFLKTIIFLFPAKFVKKTPNLQNIGVTAKCLMLTVMLLNAILHDVILLNVVPPQTFTTQALLEYPKIGKSVRILF